MDHREIQNRLEACRLPEWETLPDFGVYMDQLLGLVSRALAGTGAPVDLTASMVETDVKAGIMEKPAGKKYSRDALAQLLMIMMLKLTTPMDLLKALLHPPEGTDTETLYRQFCNEQDAIILDFGRREDSQPMEYALQSAYLQYVLRLKAELNNET